MGDFYRRLFALKRGTRALWNAGWGGRMIPVRTTAQEHVLAFVRRSEHDRVLGLFNLSPHDRTFTVTDGPVSGDWADWADGAPVTVTITESIQLPAWGYRVLLG
jgi:hypothetical protein